MLLSISKSQELLPFEFFFFFNSSLTQLRRLEELDLGNNEIYNLVSLYRREI